VPFLDCAQRANIHLDELRDVVTLITLRFFLRIVVMNGFTIRAMRPDEISLALDWAAAEGWNPGNADASCFASVDAEGFLIAELDGAPAATISCVNYDARFAFLGFYIVRPDLRGKGYGLRIWDAAIAHAGARVVGLDGELREVGLSTRLRQCALRRHDRNARRATREHHCLGGGAVRGGGGRRRQRVSGDAIGVPARVDHLTRP
jgi:GNAT superfamily N-acetyltransferase